MRSHATMTGAPGALAGMRLGVIRESMVMPPGSKTEEPIVTAAVAGNQRPSSASGWA